MSEIFTAESALRSRPAPARAACGVTVLLATYNGEAFLPDQLDSLITQTLPGWTLLWRDDGSADRSVALMEAFARRAPGRVRRLNGPPGRIGVAASYHSLALHAPQADCLAFCDQDDVWLPGKLARGLAALADIDPSIPALYCARQVLVDAALHPIGTSLPVYTHPDFAMALAQNIATGCTILLNQAAAALFRAAPPPPETLHDWWSYLLVLGAGGQVLLDDEPAVLYRQHGRNLIGAPHTRARRAIAALRRGPAAFMDIFRAHIAALRGHAGLLSPRADRVTRDISRALGQGVFARIAVLRRHRLRRQTRLESALFYLWFLIG